jgi:hypothetical protein
MPDKTNLRKLRGVEAFLMGVGSVWSIFPMVTIPAKFDIPACSDAEAIAADWRAVGLDMLCATNEAGLAIDEKGQ